MIITCKGKIGQQSKLIPDPMDHNTLRPWGLLVLKFFLIMFRFVKFHVRGFRAAIHGIPSP